MAKVTPEPTPTPAAKEAAKAPTAPVSLLDRIKAQVAAMKPEEVKAQLEKIKAQRAKHGGGKKGPLTPEQKAKRTAYNKQRIQRPEVKEKMKAYRSKPETKAKQKAYRQSRAEKVKLLLAKAKELGIE
jgi:hypothetical protein